FLGDTPPERADAIAQRLSAQVPNLLPVDLALTGLGVFPGWAAPRVLWVGLGGDLAELGLLEPAGLGFPAERRAFRPHLTIGRVRDTATPEARRRIGEGIRRASAAPRSFPAGTVHLMRSQLSPAGASYQPIATWVSRFLANP
ncbi:MAG TPA: RNA 2',3'-cyclic phosphodiesterase, partial [Dehalococcoidia bacterium]|nr:RNA 2',3'-cyclic phosphodiesterase [Dehalococcoidia bacterium]